MTKLARIHIRVSLLQMTHLLFLLTLCTLHQMLNILRKEKFKCCGTQMRTLSCLTKIQVRNFLAELCFVNFECNVKFQNCNWT